MGQKRYRVGVIGCGNIGVEWTKSFVAASARWDLAGICDIDQQRRQAAAEAAPGVRVTACPEEILNDPTLDLVGLFTRSDTRPQQIRQALAAGKHVLAEKPIAADLATEAALLKEIEQSDRLVAVNLFNRNAWYHHEARDFIAGGEIGKIGIIRVCHMTSGLIPLPEVRPEGPPFHDCGMHYVDVARWYAQAEYDSWHAQGVRMWAESDPWWVTVHGTFTNGVVFEITQGFVYGQLAAEPTAHSGFECIGTHGVIRMEHDFETVRLTMHGTDRTIRKQGPYGGKKFPVMLKVLADSLDAGRNLGLPSARDSVIASRVAQEMQEFARGNAPPVIGSLQDLERIAQHKQRLKQSSASRGVSSTRAGVNR